MQLKTAGTKQKPSNIKGFKALNYWLQNNQIIAILKAYHPKKMVRLLFLSIFMSCNSPWVARHFFVWRFAMKNFFQLFSKLRIKTVFSCSTPWGTKPQAPWQPNTHSTSTFLNGVESSAEWRYAKNHLPFGVITESKVGSDSELFWNIRLLRIRRWNVSGTMILLYGAGGEPGRGEIPMSSVSNWTLVDFLLRIWGMRSN